MRSQHADIAALLDALVATDRDASRVTAGLSAVHGMWRPQPGTWSVAQCLDHLATTNRVYLRAMTEAVAQGGGVRRGPATPGLLGAWFVRSLEPPVRAGRRQRSPVLVAPHDDPDLAAALDTFLTSNHAVRAFLTQVAELDLRGTRFRNPFVRGVRFSLATGFHAIAAHNRRHLWQARRVRDVLEGSDARR